MQVRADTMHPEYVRLWAEGTSAELAELVRGLLVEAGRTQLTIYHNDPSENRRIVLWAALDQRLSEQPLPEPVADDLEADGIVFLGDLVQRIEGVKHLVRDEHYPALQLMLGYKGLAFGIDTLGWVPPEVETPPRISGPEEAVAEDETAGG